MSNLRLARAVVSVVVAYCFSAAEDDDAEDKMVLGAE